MTITDFDRAVRRFRRAVSDLTGTSASVRDDIDHAKDLWNNGARAEALAFLENETDWWRN